MGNAQSAIRKPGACRAFCLVAEAWPLKRDLQVAMASLRGPEVNAERVVRLQGLDAWPTWRNRATHPLPAPLTGTQKKARHEPGLLRESAARYQPEMASFSWW
jgi:hypothetical protein